MIPTASILLTSSYVSVPPTVKSPLNLPPMALTIPVLPKNVIPVPTCSDPSGPAGLSVPTPTRLLVASTLSVAP